MGVIDTLNLETGLGDVLINLDGMERRSSRSISSRESDITSARMADAPLIGTAIAETDYEEYKSEVQQTN
jgi:hypothetical protein